jgi:hypothetical protein
VEASATLEAGSDTAAQEAEVALQAEAERLEAAQQLEDAQRRSQEAAETGLTQAQREALAEHDGGTPDGEGPGHEPPAGKKPRQRAKQPEQGNLEGGWEKLIGGAPDSVIKVSLHKPAGVEFEKQPEKLLKQTVHRIMITVKVTEFGSADTLDPETHDVAESKGKRKLRVLSGVFLAPEEYIAGADDEA